MHINKNKSKKDKVKKGKGSKQDEAGQPVKRRKYLTAACDFCKHRKVKCDGNHPCAFCTTKGQECIYSQRAKRGRRPDNKNTNETKIVFEKNEEEEDEILPTAEDTTTTTTHAPELAKAQDSSSLVSELELYTVAERTWAVGEFSRSARGWAAELVEVDVVTRPVSLAQQAQLYAILAHTIRVNADAHKAEVYFQEATTLVKQVFDEVSVDAARAMFLVGFYVPLTGVNPKAHIYFSLCATLAKKLSSYDVTMRRTYGLAIIMAIMCDSDSSAKQKHARLLRHIEEHGNMGGTYEKTQTLIAKIYSFIALKFNNFWDINNLSRIKEINFTREEQDSLMEALTYGETFAINNLSELSVGLVVLFKIYKVLVLWRSGDPRAAEEALECINFCENSSVAIFFAPDIMTLMVLVLCLEETTSPNSLSPSPTAHMARDFVRRLCIANGQQEYLPYLSAGLASNLAASPFSPPLSSSSYNKFSPVLTLPSPSLQFDVSSPSTARTFPQSPPLLLHQQQMSKNEKKQEKIQERERQIHALQHQLDEMRRNELHTLQQHVNNLRENEITTLHRQIDDMRKVELQMLQQEIDNMRKIEIQSLQQEVETMRKGEMHSLQQQVYDLQRQVRALQLNVAPPSHSPPHCPSPPPSYLPPSPPFVPSPQLQQFPIQVYHPDISISGNSNASQQQSQHIAHAQPQHTHNIPQHAQQNNIPQYSSNILQHMNISQHSQQHNTSNILQHTQNFPHLHDTPQQHMQTHFTPHDFPPLHPSLHHLSSSSELPLLDDLLSFNFA